MDCYWRELEKAGAIHAEADGISHVNSVLDACISGTALSMASIDAYINWFIFRNDQNMK